MKKHCKSRKRPCRICRKWFQPNPRVKDQKTCGKKECQKSWHNKKCAEWNKKNKAYFRGIYLGKKLSSLSGEKKEDKTSRVSGNKLSIPPRFDLKLPRREIQEAIGAQHLVIIEYTGQLLYNRVQEAIRR